MSMVPSFERADTMKALLCVDIQYDFLPGGALAVKDADQILPVVKQLKAEFESQGQLVVATQDWHPPGHGSFASTHLAPVYSDGELSGLAQTMWPDHCVQNTPGARLFSDLSFDLIVQKGTDQMIDSYSGFFNNERGHDTGLHDLLQKHNVTEVFLCGLATDFCVKYTALDAARLGYVVYVVEDAMRGVDLPPGNVAAALDEMRQAKCHVITSAAVPALLAAR